MITLTTGQNPSFAVIWLHGLGADGHDFEPIVPELRLPDSPAVRFIFPHAPVRPITINGGAAMRGWYDITSLDFEQRQQDAEGIRSSRDAIVALIQAQIDEGIPAANIVLAGFSQGGAIALYTGLTFAEKLGGILALSTYLPLQDDLDNTLNPQNLAIPIFMGHGQHDDVIAIRYAEQSRDTLQTLGAQPAWHTYPMPHSVNMDEINDISAWFQSILGKL